MWQQALWTLRKRSLPSQEMGQTAHVPGPNDIYVSKMLHSQYDMSSPPFMLQPKFGPQVLLLRRRDLQEQHGERVRGLQRDGEISKN